MKFELLSGGHADAKSSAKAIDGKPNPDYLPGGYNPGAIIDADIDLVGRFGKNKFKLVGGASDAAPSDVAVLEPPKTVVAVPGQPIPENKQDFTSDLEQMTRTKMFELAKDENVKVGRNDSKPELVAKIAKALSARG